MATASFVLAARAQTATYDVASDFSTTSNPNGVWSYNENDQPLTQTQVNVYLVGWGYYSSFDASISQTTPALSGLGWNDEKAGDVVLHAPSVPYGGPAAYMNIRWTSPANGVISITGRAWDAEFNPGRDANWWLSVGGTSIASRSSVSGLQRSDTAAQFSSNLLPGHSLTEISVTQGVVVEFAVATGTYYGHFAGVEESISLTVRQTVPVVTWTNPAPISYGTALSSNQLNATANVPGKFAYNPTNGAVLNVGTNTLSASFTPTDTFNYSNVTASVSLVVIAPQPAISIQKAVYITSTNLLAGLNYQVRASSDSINWTNQGSAFTATTNYWRFTNYWDVSDWNRLFFRLQTAP